MATIPKPETEEKLNQLASRLHRSKEEVLDEAVDQLLAYNNWFEGKVKASLAAVERGEVVPDEQVLAWIEQRGNDPRCELTGRSTPFPTYRASPLTSKKQLPCKPRTGSPGVSTKRLKA